MGDELDAEDRARRGRRWFAVVTLLLVAALLTAGAWISSQVPAAVALAPSPSSSPGLAVPDTTKDVRAAMTTDRLAAASGRSLQSLADKATAPTAAGSEAPVVAGAEADHYAETLDQLTEAELAAAEQLAMTEQDVKDAKAERERAAKELVAEEAAAADAVDAAIDAAIAAAQAQTAFVPGTGTYPLGSGGSIPESAATSTSQVLALVKQYFPADEVGNAMAVSRCESGHANRVGKANGNGTRDFGVFQINDGGTLQAALRKIGVAFEDISDARAKAMKTELNVRMARAIWDARGWQPWVCAAKLKIVAGLYQRNHGPMFGKYDEFGRAL